VHPDSARELKALLLQRLRSAPPTALTADRPGGAAWPPVAVGLAPVAGGRARVAVRLRADADRAVLPDLGRTTGDELDIRVVGPIRALSSPTPGELQRRIRPLRPGCSVAHPEVTAGTLGGFVRTSSGLSILSNNHVLAASDGASVGDPILQPGPGDGGTPDDRVATLTRSQRFRPEGGNLVDAAVAVLDAGVEVDAAAYPGGPLVGPVPPADDIDPDEAVEKVGRTTAHTVGRITAVEVDGVAVQYDGGVFTFDDQVEIEGSAGAFSAGGDSGSVIWRSRDRAPLALLFAGSTAGGGNGAGLTFANPLVTVLDVLSAEWAAAPPPPSVR
jgi:hypothetical protein